MENLYEKYGEKFIKSLTKYELSIFKDLESRKATFRNYSKYLPIRKRSGFIRIIRKQKNNSWARGLSTTCIFAIQKAYEKTDYTCVFDQYTEKAKLHIKKLFDDGRFDYYERMRNYNQVGDMIFISQEAFMELCNMFGVYHEYQPNEKEKKKIEQSIKYLERFGYKITHD